jgi:GH15 family glucan-1,4-alpha-glucosidase
VKKLIISNLKDVVRKISLFFNHDFHIYGDAIGDTVMYDSTINAIIQYKRQSYFPHQRRHRSGQMDTPVRYGLQGAAGDVWHLEGRQRWCIG